MSGHGHVPTRSERAYQVLLKVYPKKFREEYGPHMIQAFGDLCRAEYGRAGAVGLVLVWVRTVVDLLRTAASERTGAASTTTFVIPVAGSPRMVRWGGAAAICGAVCALVALVLGDLSITYTREPILNALSAYRDGESSYSPFIVLLHPVVGEFLSTVAGLFFVTAFLGLYALVARRFGRIAFLGGVLICAGFVALVAFAGSNAYRAFLALSGGPGEVWTDPDPISGLIGIATPLYLLGALLLSVAVFRTRVLGRWSLLPLVLFLLPTLLRFVLIDAAFPVQDHPQAVREGLMTLVIVHSPELLLQISWIVIGYLMWRSSPAIAANREVATVER